MKTAVLLFPHQLFPDCDVYHSGSPIFMIEEHLFFKEFQFHKTKLAYHRASMKCHEQFLLSRGVEVHYIASQHALSDVRSLIHHLRQKGVTTITYIDPTDNWLEKRINTSARAHAIRLERSENPLFINTRASLAHFFKPSKKTYFQTSFYKQQRLQHNILLDANKEPIGGKWSFDGENRKKYPKNKQPPAIPFLDSDSYWNEALSYVEQHFGNNPGQLSAKPLYPYTRETTLVWLQQFLEYRFHGFGDYEDAIVKDASFLHHSVLTPMLNIGLISPGEVLQKAIAHEKTNAVPINAMEGFVRQILGWREFIRGMYECKGTASRNSNFWGFTRKIPNSFYTGTTGIEPVDKTIKKVLRDGYCHHIERLMILGNFMLLCEFHPKEVYRWFMELFIDAYDWVMVPNVYGMSQFADGGLFATKPYISGSNYILKMSDYGTGDWQTTWDGLFWRFMDVHRNFFEKNPRLAMLLRTLDRMDTVKKNHLLQTAENFLSQME